VADNTTPNARLNEPFENVDSDDYDGRSFVHPDNESNVSAYVGVDPIYQNYANEGEKPYPFTQEELDLAAEKAGLVEVIVDDGEDDDEDDDEAA
jgi:hypothetical protein